MAFKRKAYIGVYEDTHEEFVCDTAADLNDLPSGAPQGSAAFVIEDSTTWMINSRGEWIETDMEPSGGGDTTLTSIDITENGTYRAPSGTAYNRVTVAVEDGGAPVPDPDPADGNTHIWITIDDNTPDNRLTFPLYWRQSVSNGVSVDWGDGSASQTFSGTGAAEHEHTYAEPGDYEIVLTVTSGVLTLDGTEGVSGYSIFGSKANLRCYNRQRITRIAVGNNAAVGAYMAQYAYGLNRVSFPDTLASIGSGAFDGCYSIREITIPNGVTSIGDNAFNYCHSLESIVIPDSVISIGSYAFRNCYTLRGFEFNSGITAISEYAFQGCYMLTTIDIPSTITSIGAGAFHSCYGLTSVTIPSSVTYIGDSAFLNCYGIKEYHIGATTPPSLAGSSAFTGIAPDCVIYVPASANHSVLNAYKSATNWSVYAGKMREEGT